MLVIHGVDACAYVTMRPRVAACLLLTITTVASAHAADNGSPEHPSGASAVTQVSLSRLHLGRIASTNLSACSAITCGCIVPDGGMTVVQECAEATCTAERASSCVPHADMSEATCTAACQPRVTGEQHAAGQASQPDAVPDADSDGDARYIVRFKRYCMAAEHRATVATALRDLHQSAGTAANASDSNSQRSPWRWIVRENKAAAYPTDFGLLACRPALVEAMKVSALVLHVINKYSNALFLFSTECIDLYARYCTVSAREFRIWTATVVCALRKCPAHTGLESC